MAVLVLGGIVLFFVFIGVSGSKWEKKRLASIELIAKNLDFSFLAQGRETTLLVHNDFPLFSKRRGRSLGYEMWGTELNNPVSIFEFRYSEKNGKNSSVYTQTVLSVDCSHLNSVQFNLKPEDIFHKMGQVFGYQDIDFVDFPVFSKEYLLRGENESVIRQLFTPKVIEYFEKNKNIFIEVQSNTFIFYKLDIVCPPEELEQFYKDGLAALDVLVK